MGERSAPRMGARHVRDPRRCLIVGDVFHYIKYYENYIDSIVLYYIVLYCIVLYCIVLYCIALYCIMV